MCNLQSMHEYVQCLVLQVLPITQSKQANDGWGTAGGEEDTNGDEGIAMTRAESYDILIPKGRKFYYICYYEGMEQLCSML